MFRKTTVPMRCRKYEARLENYIDGGADSELRDHLSLCADCRAALADSRMGGNILRAAWAPAGEPRSAFLAGVLAKIRVEQARIESPAAFWNPLEFLASRLALTAAMLLLALSAYMAGYAPRRMPSATISRTELGASDFPQVPRDPESNEEVLVSLSERLYER
jgi:hypothetical protein